MKRMVGLLLTAVLLCTLLSVFAIPVLADSPYAVLDGNGSESSPYIIKNADDWNAFVAAVKNDPDNGKGLYFKQTGDIGSAENPVWTSVSNTFNGVFDGADKTIWYDGSTSLFDFNNGEIMNIIVRSCDELFFPAAGGVICSTNYGVIDHCVNYVPLSTTSYCGGICGMNSGLIVNCINYASVKSDFNGTGGICGNNYKKIVNCVNAGTVSRGGICVISTHQPPANIDVCFSCSYPFPDYGITELFGPDTSTPEHRCLNHCSYYVPNSEFDSRVFIEASNNNFNNNFASRYSGLVTAIFDGVSNMNSALDAYDNQTGRTLYRWKLGEDGLPTFDDSPNPGSILSGGNLWIILAGVVVVVGAIVALVVVKKKKKPALAGENNE